MNSPKQMSSTIFKQFVVNEEKIEKKEFEPAENIFTDLLVMALAAIGASGASPEVQERVTEMATPLMRANCNEVSVVEGVVEQEIKAIKNPEMSQEVSELWNKMKVLKENAPCSRGVFTGTTGVLAGTTYSGSSDNYNHVTPDEIGKKMTKKQMEEFIANIENEKIQEQIAKEEARVKQIQEEHETQQWMIKIFKTNPTAVLNIIEENANKEWDTKEQKQFWQDKQIKAEKYKEQVEKNEQSREKPVEKIIEHVFGSIGVFVTTLISYIGISALKDMLKQKGFINNEKKE